MRAVVVAKAGGIEALSVSDVQDPIPAGGEVAVRVRAAGLNRADLLQRLGLYPAPPGVRPDVLGLEFSGEVAAMGPGSHGWSVGDRVMAIASGAAQAECVVAHERMLLPIPAKLSFEEAAALPEAFLTAHDALYRQGGLGPGEPVLIHAVGSGVGTAAVQLAHAVGQFTLGTARSPWKLEQASPLGLDRAILVEGQPRFARLVREATEGQGVRAVADFVGGSYLSQNLESLAIGGTLVAIGLLGGVHGEIDLGQLLTRRLRIVGTTLRGRPLEEKIAVTQLFARQVLPLFARGLLRPIVDRVFPLNEVRAAHERLAANEGFGKIVLTL